MPNGLFWTAPLPQGAFQMTNGGQGGQLNVENMPLIDTFQFAGIYQAPSQLTIDATWTATGARVPRGKGTSVPPNHPDAHSGNLAEARATVKLSGFTTGFGFEATGNTDPTVAMLGTMRNGAFLT